MEDGVSPSAAEDPPNGRKDRDKEAEGVTTNTNNTTTDTRQTDASPATTDNPDNYILQTPAKTPSTVPEQLLTPLSPNGRKYKHLYDDMRGRYTDLVKKVDSQKEEYERMLSEKDTVIKELNCRLQAANHHSTESRPMKMNNEDIFIIKPKKGAKNQKPTNETCTISGCENTNIDLIKCNLCGNAVCEDCSSVKFAKLKPVMNQCNTLYFTCRGCDILMREKEADAYDIMNTKISLLEEELHSCEKQNEKLDTEINATRRIQETCDKLTGENKTHANKITELQNTIAQRSREHSGCKGELNNLNQQVKTLTDHQDSLRVLLEERENSLHEAEAKLVSLEQETVITNPPATGGANIEALITKRFDKIDKNIDALIEKKLANLTPLNNQPLSNGETKKTLFSSIVGAPTGGTANAATSVVTSRNAELVEKQEKERRINNLVIYGISEQRVDDNVSLQDQDKEFMNTLLGAIEVNVSPKQILRLGKESTGRNRPVKVILKCEDDKNKIMSSLNKLKNADESLRGISVRDDYTIEERQLIKTMTEEAKRKNEADNVTYWKVRGTPKNGLRVVKIATRN